MKCLSISWDGSLKQPASSRQFFSIQVSFLSWHSVQPLVVDPQRQEALKRPCRPVRARPSRQRKKSHGNSRWNSTTTGQPIKMRTARDIGWYWPPIGLLMLPEQFRCRPSLRLPGPSLSGPKSRRQWIWRWNCLSSDGYVASAFHYISWLSWSPVKKAFNIILNEVLFDI